MNYKDIVIIMKKETTRKGYVLEERDSASTTSHYFKLYDDKISLLFRIADHNTKANIMTLRMDKKNTPESVKNFINKRMKDLCDRRRKEYLGW